MTPYMFVLHHGTDTLLHSCPQSVWLSASGQTGFRTSLGQGQGKPAEVAGSIPR